MNKTVLKYILNAEHKWLDCFICFLNVKIRYFKISKFSKEEHDKAEQSHLIIAEKNINYHIFQWPVYTGSGKERQWIRQWQQHLLFLQPIFSCKQIDYIWPSPIKNSSRSLPFTIFKVAKWCKFHNNASFAVL